jgi:hypothetical protein
LCLICFDSWGSHHCLLQFFLGIGIGERIWPLCAIFNLFYKDIVLELSFDDLSIWKRDSSETMLHAVLPVTLVSAAVDPIHLSVAMALVFPVLTDIIVSTLPVELTLAVLFVHGVLTRILVAVRILFIFLPFSFAMLHTLAELANEASS